MRRREALKLGLAAGAAAVAGLGPSGARCITARAVDARITIMPVNIELATGVNVRTIAFDGTVPVPRVERGAVQTTVDFHNATDDAVVVHSPAFTEPLIAIAPRVSAPAVLRRFVALASAGHFKPCHAYCSATEATAHGTIAFGQDQDHAEGAYDQLQVLSIKRWQRQPTLAGSLLGDGTVAYDYAGFNDRVMAGSEPIKVRYGDRVRFHFSNGSTLCGTTLALPLHRFLIMALDGHSVPTPRLVDRLYIGPAESVDALVTMDRPGRWVLSSTRRQDRAAGLGRLVEYVGATGAPKYSDYGIVDWDYTRFGAAAGHTAETTSTRFASLSLGSVRLLASTDPQCADPTPRATSRPLRVSLGERYRLSASNFTRAAQTLQVLAHDIEILRVAGEKTAGLHKDVVTLPSFTSIEFAFIARSTDVYLAHGRHVTVDTNRLS